VMRSAAELVEALPQLSDRSATPRAVQKTATDEAARVLGVKSIDWKRQMLLVVAAGTHLPDGYRVEVVGLKKKGGTLKVSWKLCRPEIDEAIERTSPALLVLVPAHDGEVEFEQVK